MLKLCCSNVGSEDKDDEWGRGCLQWCSVIWCPRNGQSKSCPLILGFFLSQTNTSYLHTAFILFQVCVMFSLLLSFQVIVKAVISVSAKVVSGTTIFVFVFVLLLLLLLFVVFYVKTSCALRVWAFFHKTVRVCHIYCNFNIGFTWRITVIFGTLKDGSLLINTLASNICFGYRNMFQNGVDALSKIVDAFLSKSSKFHLVRIIR